MAEEDGERDEGAAGVIDGDEGGVSDDVERLLAAIVGMCPPADVGLVDEELSPRLRELVSTRVLDRARVLGAALRVAYLVSASTTGVLPKTPMVVERGRLLLRFDNGFKALAGERVFVRLRQLARLIGREPVMETA